MNRLIIPMLAFFVVFTLSSCGKREETPPKVSQAYSEMLNALDPDAPGESFAKLQWFARNHSQYAIFATVEKELKARRPGLENAYLRGRDLARLEQFEQAETVLKDLASNLHDERPGKLAREFLKFEFPFMHSTRLLMRGDVEGAEKIARELAQKKLTSEQMASVQSLLDQVSTTGLGVRMMYSSTFMFAAHMLQVYFANYYAEWGKYPEATSLNSPELASLTKDEPFNSAVASIEEYTATYDDYAIIIAGKHSDEYLRVTSSGIKKVEYTSPTATPEAKNLQYRVEEGK